MFCLTRQKNVRLQQGMFTASLSYAPETNVLLVLDTQGTAQQYVYEVIWQPLNKKTGTVLSSSTRVTQGVELQLLEDGVYMLQLVRHPLQDARAPGEPSQVLEHVQVAASLAREKAAYIQATQGCCEGNFHEVLCERRYRQLALLAYAQCNKELADKRLRQRGGHCT